MGKLYRRHPRHRLYLQVYLSLVAMIGLVSIIAPLTWAVFGEPQVERRFLHGMGYLIAEAIPPGLPPEETAATMGELSNRFNANISLYTPDRHLVASTGSPLPCPLAPGFARWHERKGYGPCISFRLPDNRIVVASSARYYNGRHVIIGGLWIMLMALLLATAAYPVARRLTRRLERLQTGVVELGKGALHTRVPVEGRDEIGELARSFNDAAERIEALVAAQKNVLAVASHEFRTPLTRIRVALELYEQNPRPALKEDLQGDIEELDRLVEEVLTVSRLDSLDGITQKEEVDLLALLAEEASRYDADVTGESVVILGDSHHLRRMIRNLLENGKRYGGTRLQTSVTITGKKVALRICDRGPGVSDEERQKIFEPFYRPASQAESATGGAGLGLALVKQIAALHGGSVRCVPREGGGSCFEVWFLA